MSMMGTRSGGYWHAAVGAAVALMLVGCSDGQDEALPSRSTDKAGNALVTASRVSAAQEVADLLEHCDAHSPLRYYGDSKVDHDTVGVLLKLAQVDVETLVEGARLFLSKSAGRETAPADREGREDLLELLKGVIVNYPDTKVHICWTILVNENGKLKIGDDWPGVRMGIWLPRDFAKQLPEDLKKYGKRDLTEFLKNYSPPKQS
jgi:hypothetical protein